MSELLSSPLFWILLSATSEILALIPQEKVRSNSMLQLAVSAVRHLQASRNKGA